MEQEIVIVDDKCYVDTYMFGDTYERRLVMTKEVFIECYKRWIKEIKND